MPCIRLPTADLAWAAQECITHDRIHMAARKNHYQLAILHLQLPSLPFKHCMASGTIPCSAKPKRFRHPATVYFASNCLAVPGSPSCSPTLHRPYSNATHPLLQPGLVFPWPCHAGRVMRAAMSFPDLYNLSSHTRHTCAYAMACSRALGFCMVS